MYEHFLMINHLVLLKWNDKVTPEAIASVSQGFAELAESIPEIVCYEYGPDAGVYPGNSDYGLLAKFNSVDDLKVYVMHPEHQAFMKKVTGPIMQSFASIQFESD